MAGRPITCAYNPSVGKDIEYTIGKTSSPKKVVVVGGGPAGLEAARVLTEMGHEVILYEESDRLGGQALLAGMLPGKRDFHHVITYYESTLKRLGVEIHLGAKVDSESIAAQKPDVVIIATGSVAMNPDIPGIENPNVLSVRQVLLEEKEVGKSVVVLGGGNTGSEIAEYLSQRGHTVSILEMGNKTAADIGPARRYLLMRRLRENKVRNYLLCRIKSIQSDKVLYIRQTADGHRSLRELTGVDTFVNALGMKSRDDLGRELAGNVEKLFIIGDALHPGKILDAVAEGAAIARMIENGQQPLN
jgi:NADPH-dependent 2,4-dienoyl-CoA reductase/sulfur reductase-like enzyme